ncbi:MAG: S8 family serine peptidase [Candidatus Eiseniibacteriota bacterium]
MPRANPGAGAAVLLLVAARAIALDLGDGRVHLRHVEYGVETGPPVTRSVAPEAEPAPGEAATWIAVISGPADLAVRRALDATGARIVGYVPSNAYLVRATQEAAEALRGESFVRRVDLYRSEWKVSPDVGGRTFRDPARVALGTQRLLDVHVFAGEDARAAAERALEAGARVLAVHGPEAGNRLLVVAGDELLPALSRISEVEWIEETGEPTLRNDNVRWVIQSNANGDLPLYDNGLLGAGEIIGHIDGEILMSSCFFLDPLGTPIGPSHRKVVAYRTSGLVNGAAHGTHTAGTAAGEQADGTTTTRGMAPKAKLSFENVNDIDGFNDSASNLLAALEAAYADGARIHTNSWGESSVGSYTTWSVDVDTFSRNREENLVLFAVINGGASVISPENAKSCLATAATLAAPNQHLHGSGAPGPTFDGRRKPEVMAPGVGTSSAGLGGCVTASMTGTSMSAPAVAGGAALVREYFRRGYYPTGRPHTGDGIVPTGALLRAAVINSTVDLTGQAQYPSAREGWGRILLDDALYFPGDTRRLRIRDVRHAQGLSTGEVAQFTFRISDSFEPLAVTMAFTDQPASHGASLAPVNDLDLEVEGPDGLFLGNVFNVVVGESVTGGTADALNSAERVLVKVPSSGTWIVRVRGADVPLGPQGYAVVVNGGLGSGEHLTAPAPEPPAEAPADRSERLAPESWRLEPLRPSPFLDRTDIEFAVPEQAAVEISVHDVTGRKVRTLLARTVSSGEYRVSWDGRDDSGRPAAAGVYFARLTAPGVRRVERGVLLR